jgi:hypothetical protein
MSNEEWLQQYKAREGDWTRREEAQLQRARSGQYVICRACGGSGYSPIVRHDELGEQSEPCWICEGRCYVYIVPRETEAS